MKFPATVPGLLLLITLSAIMLSNLRHDHTVRLHKQRSLRQKIDEAFNKWNDYKEAFGELSFLIMIFIFFMFLF